MIWIEEHNYTIPFGVAIKKYRGWVMYKGNTFFSLVLEVQEHGSDIELTTLKTS